MQLSRKTIYNEQLDCEAVEVVTTAKDSIAYDEEKKIILEGFLASLIKETNENAKQFKLLVPLALFPLLNHLEEAVKEKILVHLSLKNDAKETLDLVPMIKDAGFNLSVQLCEKKSLENIPQGTEYLILSNDVATELSNGIDYLNGKFNVVVSDINDYAQLKAYKEKKVMHYQGSFIEKPEEIGKGNIAPNKASILRLMSLLNDPDVELQEVSRLLTADNVLSYKLLKIVNSPLYRGVCEIQSVQDAIIRFGYTNLRQWVMMLNLSKLGNKPVELTKYALLRAILCSKSAEHYNHENLDTFYTAGLLSLLDAFLDRPIEEPLEEISLADDIKDAIISYKGEVGEILQLVIEYQHGNVTEEEAITSLYIESSEEARKTFHALGL